jgi:hypothetical protein
LVRIVRVLKPDFMSRRHIHAKLAKSVRHCICDVLIKMELDRNCHP